MYFILNRTIKFTPDTGGLSLINKSQGSIELSNAGTRLLLALIKNIGDVVSRDELLTTVWGDYGYTPSNNNLYMAISELRKSFASLGETERIIITFPRIGIKMEAIVDTIVKEKKEMVMLPVNKKAKNLKRTALASAFLLLFVVVIYINISEQKTAKNNDQNAPFLKQGYCDVIKSKNELSFESIKITEDGKEK